jgi:hypothetical protein
MLLSIINLYSIGCILSLLIYDVYFYEKYNGMIFNKFTKLDLFKLSTIFLSWICIYIQIMMIYKYSFNQK